VGRYHRPSARLPSLVHGYPWEILFPDGLAEVISLVTPPLQGPTRVENRLIRPPLEIPERWNLGTVQQGLFDVRG